MNWRSFIHIAFLTLVAGGALSFFLAPKDRFNSAEETLFGGLDNLRSEDSPAPKDFVDAFDLPERCRSGNCYVENLPLTGLGKANVHLNDGVDGSIFTIEALGNACIRTDRVTTKYRGGRLETNCLDAVCPSYNVRDSWGLVAFYWPKAPSNCIRNVAINTERWVRGRDQ